MGILFFDFRVRRPLVLSIPEEVAGRADIPSPLQASIFIYVCTFEDIKIRVDRKFVFFPALTIGSFRRTLLKNLKIRGYFHNSLTRLSFRFYFRQ